MLTEAVLDASFRLVETEYRDARGETLHVDRELQWKFRGSREFQRFDPGIFDGRVESDEFGNFIIETVGTAGASFVMRAGTRVLARLTAVRAERAAAGRAAAGVAEAADAEAGEAATNASWGVGFVGRPPEGASISGTDSSIRT